MDRFTIDKITTRNNLPLHYRYYSANSNDVMILVHGISEDCQYLHPLAEFIATENLAHVYTPNLRGYGEPASKRGDVDYIGQHEDELMDLIKYIKEKHPEAKIIMAGHSAGGGTTLRMAQSKYKKEIDRYLLLAPFVHPLAPTVPRRNPNRNGRIKVGKLVLLYLLNTIKIRAFNHSLVYFSKKPKEKQHGGETLALSFRLFHSRYPEKYVEAIQAIDKPALVIVGEEDEVFDASQYKALFSKYSKADTFIVPNVNHDDILSDPTTFSIVKEWIQKQ